MPTSPDVELAEVLSHYDLGQLVAFDRDRRGTVNTSFSIETVQAGQRRKYFLRRYKREIRPEEILFEHALIDHIVRQRACPVARVHTTREGKTYLSLPDPDGRGEAAYYAVFDFLPGEDRYTWVGPRCTPAELGAAGRLLAQFHDAVRTLVPQGARAEARTVEILERLDDLWVDGHRHPKGTQFDAVLHEHFELVRDSIAETLQALRQPEAGAFPEVVIHSDYHPGNLRFAGEAVSGLVDFDWAKVDLRAVDVGLALWYFCVSWESEVDGELRLDDARLFLEGYQNYLQSIHGYPPLTPGEIGFMPHLVSAGNIYVIYWTIREYFRKDVDPQEYLVYLKHHAAFIRWFNRPANRARLTAMLDGLPRS